MRLAGDTGLPIPSVKNYQKQMQEISTRHIELSEFDKRDIRSSTFAICRNDFPKAVQLIKDFHTQMRALTVSGGSDDVYYLGTQFFPLTE